MVIQHFNRPSICRFLPHKILTQFTLINSRFVNILQMKPSNFICLFFKIQQVENF